MGLDHTANLRIPFCKALFFVGVVFIYFRWSICHVPLFSNAISGCFFCWVSFLFGVSDGAVVVCYRYVHEEYSLGLSNFNFFTVLPVV